MMTAMRQELEGIGLMQKFDSIHAREFQSSLKNQIKLNAANRFIHRLHCVQLVEQGCSCQQVAQWLGEHVRTIQRWVKYTHDYGIEGLKYEQKLGRPNTVRDDQKKWLQQDISQCPNELGYPQKKWSGSLLQVHLRQHYHVDLGLRQCQRLLNELKQQAVDGQGQC